MKLDGVGFYRIKLLTSKYETVEKDAEYEALVARNNAVVIGQYGLIVILMPYEYELVKKIKEIEPEYMGGKK